MGKKDSIIENNHNEISIRIRSILLLLFYVVSLWGYSFISRFHKETFRLVPFLFTSVSTEDVEDKIKESSFLTEEEKEFLLNSDFFEDILPFINHKSLENILLQGHFQDIRIESYGEKYNHYDTDLGYYNTDEPNVLHIRDYEELEDTKKDTVAHEFVHLCQNTSGYNLIIEACAEIISFEYYNEPVSVYKEQVKLVKKLMEIIGPEAVWSYNFTGDFSKIEELVRPLLTEEEYQTFLDCLSFEYYDYSVNLPKYQQLNDILKKMYQAVYQKDMDDDLIIQLINREEPSLVRYYFNERKISSENSYYFDRNEGTYQTLDLATAIDQQMIIINAITKTPIDKKLAFDLLRSGDYQLSREIDYSSANITMTRSVTTSNQFLFWGFIDGVKYENIDIDLLVQQNIISVQYYLVDYRRLSAEEYLNHQYNENAELYFSHKPDTIFKGETVYGFVPDKVMLPTIHERGEKVKVLFHS